MCTAQDLIFCPASSSEEEQAAETLSDVAGGVAALFRDLDLPLQERFLEIATSAIGSVESMMWDCQVTKKERC